MNWIDNNTIMLKDSSIMNLFDTGIVEMFPSKDWKKPKQKSSFNNAPCFIFNWKTRERAIGIITALDKLL